MILVDFFDTNVDQIDIRWLGGRVDGSPDGPHSFVGHLRLGDPVGDGLHYIKSRLGSSLDFARFGQFAFDGFEPRTGFEVTLLANRESFKFRGYVINMKERR